MTPDYHLTIVRMNWIERFRYLGTGYGTYDGRINLSGTVEIWVVYHEGVTYLSTTRPDF